MCPAGSYLKTISSTGAATCIPFSDTIPTSIPAGRAIVLTSTGYAGVDLNCPTGTSCSSDYVMAVTSTGAVSCGPATIASDCSNGIAAIDASGAVTCR